MDGSRFDAWTRRRFGLTAGGLIGSVLSLIGREGNDAEAKTRKKRCRKLGENCQSGGKPKCCKKHGLTCQPTLGGAHRCCRRGRESCTSDSQCCSGSCMDGLCHCKSNGMECGGFDGFCCSLNCAVEMNSTCQPKD